MAVINNISIRQLCETNLDTFIELIRLFEEVFEMKNFSLPAFDHLQSLLNRSDFMVFVASLENRVVGGLTAYVLEQYYSEKPLAYIYDLAVATHYQRQGIGQQLVAKVNHYCQKLGFEEVFVQADKVDDYAIDFYRATQPTAEEPVVHFYYSMDR